MKLRYITLVLFLFGTALFAQNPLDPGWLWAKRGGSTASLGSLTYEYNNERVLDVAVDADNNYYYLAEVGGYSFTLDTMGFNTYNYYSNEKDIFIFSTDEEGNYRWSKTVGGGAADFATSLGFDVEGNVYVSGSCWSLVSPFEPVHFDSDSIMGHGSLEPNPNNKKIFIIKYDSEGNFQWLQQPEEAPPMGKSGIMLKMIVEPDGTTHSLIALIAGTYFDGQLTIPPMDTIGNIIPTQTMIIKYDGAGVFEGYMLIDMKPIDGRYNFQLAYDPDLERYYIGDTGRGNSFTNPLSINGYGMETIDKAFYLAAVDNQGEVIWYHENQLIGGWQLGDIAIDNAGNIYLTGDARDTDVFAGYVFEQQGGTIGNKKPFLIKFDNNGNLIWGTNAEFDSPFVGQSIILEGDNVYLGLGMLNNTWDGIDISGPVMQGYVPDIQIIRFDAQTGTAQEVIQNNEITFTRDAIMAMALDNNGDLVVGGYFGSDLFAGSDFHIHNTGQDSDFFIAKYRPDTTLGIAENTAMKTVRAYPNPTTGVLKLRSDMALNAYSLIDLQGRVVARGRVAGNQIDLSGLEAGVYVLRVHDLKGDIINLKVVKE